MIKKIALAFFLMCGVANAQTVVLPCSQNPAGGPCLPASTTNGLPVAVIPSTGASGTVLTSNGVGSVATFQPSSGGGAPSGPAGGDLGSTYPNPTVTSIAHVNTGTLPAANGGSPFVAPEQYGAAGDGKFIFDGAFTGAGTVASNTGTSTTPTTPAVTTITANDLLLSVFSTSSAWSVTPSVGTTRASIAYASGQYGMLASDQLIASPSTTTPVSGTTSGSAVSNNATIALAPSGGSVSFVASTTYVSNNTNAVTLTKPTGTASGDYMVACQAYFDNPAGSFSPYIKIPAGWILITSKVTSFNEFTCYGHVAGASEPSSYIWSYFLGSGASGIMLDYRNTSGPDNQTNTLTSATAAFTSAVVGDPICVAGITGHPTLQSQYCGTITGYNSATSVNLSFGVNQSFSALQFTFGTSDDTAFNTMLTTAPCSTIGCKIQLQPHHYILTQPLTLVKNVPVSIVGSAPSVPNTANSTPLVNANSGSMLNFVTQSLTQAAVSITGTLHRTSSTVTDRLQDLAIYGGAGIGWDGGGADGLDILNWQGSVVENVYIMDFTGQGAYVDGLAASNFLDYTSNNFFNYLYLSYNGGGGFQVGSATGVFNLETMSCTNCQIEVNGGPGVTLAGANIQGFELTGSIVQWDNVFQPAAEVSTTGTVIGGVVEGNYFEVDILNGSRSSGAFNNSAGQLGLSIGSNYYTGGYTPLTFSNSATHIPTCSSSSSATNTKTATVTDAKYCSAGGTYVSGGSTACLLTCTGSVWVTNYAGSAGNVSTGTKFTTTGSTCGTIGTTTGGATAGTFVSGTTGSCTGVLTMGGLTAPNGWACSANDRTTASDLIGQTASTATTATLSGTTLSGDVISFNCIGY